MYFELKENKPHGTKDDPFSTYHIKNEGRSFQIPVHWHDELEIIYVKSGFLTVSISGENYIGTPGDAFVVSPGNLHFMGSQTDTADYFTFLFPLKYISFCINDMLDDKLLEPLKNGHLMISPRVKDTAKELCEQLVEIYVAKNKKTESIITAQIKTKIILLQFILEMWEKGFVIENDKSGRNTIEKEMISYIQQNFMEKISLKEFSEQFHLSEKYISFRTDDMLDDKLLEPLNSGHLMINPRVKDSAKELCEQLIDIYMAENDETESKITAQIKTKIILLQFILEMWKKGFVIENDTSGRNIVEKEMVSYIQQNFTGKISLKEFGEQFHLSEKYISRYFKEHFHITLSQYITYLRLENAKQLLQDTDLSVTETAMQSGYQNVSYFIRSFKKAYGISPLKYRNSGILTKI